MHTANKTLALFITLMPFTSFCQQGTYTIKGKLLNVNAPAKIYLVAPGDQLPLDSSNVENGAFKLNGSTKNPTQVLLYLSKENTGYNSQLRDATSVYLEPGTILVESPKEFLYAAKVSGTPNNDARLEYQQIFKVKEPIDKEIADLKKAVLPGKPESESVLNKIAALEKRKIDVLVKVAAEFIVSHPNSLVSVQGLNDLADFEDYAKLNKLFEGFSPAVRNSEEAKKFVERLAVLKRVALGSLAPELTIPDTSGTLLKLSSLRGKYVLVDVWASWCGPCRKENPNQIRTYEKFKNQNFTVIGVSLDGNRKEWLDAIYKDRLPWMQVSDLKAWDSKMVSLYGLSSIPQNYLLDPDGVIVAKNLQGQDLYDKLSEVFTSN